MPFPLAFLFYPYLFYGFVPSLSSIYLHFLSDNPQPMLQILLFVLQSSLLLPLRSRRQLASRSRRALGVLNLYLKYLPDCLFNKDSFIFQRNSRAIYSCFSCLKPPSQALVLLMSGSVVFFLRGQIKEEQIPVEREEQINHLACWILGILAHH